MQFIDLKSQYQEHKNAIDEAIHRVLNHGQYIMGPEVTELEATLAKYVGQKHCISCASGTDSLLMALMALDIGPGDEVITVPFTFIATTEVVDLIGAKVVLVDIEEDTFNMDVNQLAAAITPRTKAIMPVGLFGQMPDMERIREIAGNIPVIEDAAQSFGASQRGKKSCNHSLVSSTSFFPAKPLGCYGDGGALFTSDDALASRLRAIRNHGGEVRYQHWCTGINGRLDTLQAAVLLAKMPHFEKEVQARARIGARYSELLAGSCITPVVAPNNTHVYAQYTVRVANRDLIAQELKAAGIPTAIYYPKPLHKQPVYASLAEQCFPVSERVADEVLSLPMHPYLSESEQDFIVQEFVKAVEKHNSSLVG